MADAQSTPFPLEKKECDHFNQETKVAVMHCLGPGPITHCLCDTEKITLPPRAHFISCKIRTTIIFFMGCYIKIK